MGEYRDVMVLQYEITNEITILEDELVTLYETRTDTELICPDYTGFVMGSNNLFYYGNETYSWTPGVCQPISQSGDYNGPTLYTDVNGLMGDDAAMKRCLQACLQYEGSTGCQFNGSTDDNPKCVAEVRTEFFINTETGLNDKRGCILWG